ncbi:hypothetical protein QBC47DRAFT_393176 [Echria macrotheca]|uniref:Uncharacterized protein n=1 Tax=Echria macrotheca TaxID=438768 RepID=A0AAJ0F0Z9_9PEZI|nr:hypothetical protein QBC47DRAFT_393176 [Echria macrotheca]
MAVPKAPQTPGMEALQQLQQIFHEVLIQTGKAMRNARRDGKDGQMPFLSIETTKIPKSTNAFNSTLDDLEYEILQAKAVLQRDIQRVREQRKPVQTAKVAAMAPAKMELDSPVPMAPATINAPGPFPVYQGPGRPIQETKQVAPFPNMGGFDLTVSPEVAPTPSPKTLPKGTPKNSPRPATISGAAGKASNTPPKKDKPGARPVTVTPVPVPVIPQAAQIKAQAQAKAAAMKPQPTPGPLQSTTPIPIPVPGPIALPPQAQNQIAGPVQMQAPAQAPMQAIPTQAPPAPQPAPAAPMANTAENIFTNMTFTLAPPSSDGPTGPPQAPEADMGGTGGDLSTFTMDSFGGNPGDGSGLDAPMQDVDMTNGTDNIDELFGPLDDGMDYDLEGDTNSFNDMYIEDSMLNSEFNSFYGI